MKNVFLDTGVIVEFLSDKSRLTESTSAILTLAELKQLKVYVTPFLYNTLYCQFSKTDGHKKMIDKLRKLNAIARTLKVNKKIIAEALNSDLEHFDAALQYYTARTNKNIDLIVTNDAAVYGKSKIALFSPDAFLSGFWDKKT
jgi:predicted nucleic acid-binding protein